MILIHNNSVTGPHKYNFSGYTVMYDRVGPDIHYSFDFNYEMPDLLNVCEAGMGFFCCRISDKTAAILESIMSLDDDFRFLDSINIIIPKELAYVSIVSDNNVAHILVLPMKPRSEIEELVDLFFDRCTSFFGEGVFEIDHLYPVGWYDFTDIHMTNVSLAVSAEEKEISNSLIGSIHPVLRAAMMGSHDPLIPEQEQYASGHDVITSAEIRMMGMMLNCHGVSLDQMREMFPGTQSKRIARILTSLVTKGIAQMDGRFVYRLTGKGRFLLGKYYR